MDSNFELMTEALKVAKIIHSLYDKYYHLGFKV